MLRTSVIGVGHLGKQHARIHAALSDEGRSQFVSACDIDDARASEIAQQHKVRAVTNWRAPIGNVDAGRLAPPTESHCEIACAVLEAGGPELGAKPIARTLDEAARMIAAAERGGA